MAELAVGHRSVQRISGGHDADQDEHDQPHALLTVVRPVREADAGARQDQDAADPPGRWRAPFGSRKRGVPGDELERQEQQARSTEPDERREQQRVADLRRLRPVDAAGASRHGHQLIGEADADDRADQGVRARRRQTQVPRAQVPDDGADEQGEHHRETGAEPTCRISSTGSSAMMP